MIISIEYVSINMNNYYGERDSAHGRQFLKLGPSDTYQEVLLFFIVFQLENILGCTIIMDCK